MIELSRRAVACKGWRWMQGMTSVWGDDDGQPMRWLCRSSSYGHVMCGPCADGHPRHNLDALPDLTDPATLGCILRLVREAWKRSTAFLYYYGGSWFFDPQQSGPTDHPSGRTEAEALVAALEAAP